jgi:hypothetical protein
VKLTRLAAASGVAGPVLFTVAWVVGSLRQAGHSAAGMQLSGLAAEDARDPQIMMAGFVALGAGTMVLGAGLGRVTAPRSAVKCDGFLGPATLVHVSAVNEGRLLMHIISTVVRGAYACAIGTAWHWPGNEGPAHWRPWLGSATRCRHLRRACSPSRRHRRCQRR